jgi:hypothetical protein
MKTEYNIQAEDGRKYAGPSWIAGFVGSLLSAGMPLEDLDFGNGANYEEYHDFDEFESQVLGFRV